ncbi:MAG: thioredoxin domain-containing protein, partial [Myxococcota bacterium]|nr:thioredoxin domain-containing protein [Myxococcota bacterium]
MKGTIQGYRLMLAATLLASLAAWQTACRSEPTPRSRAEARGRGAARASAGMSPTVCSEALLKGGLPIGEAPRKGSTDPLVAVVQFSNPDCPDCAAAAPKVDEIVAAYPDDVAVYYLNVEGAAPAIQPGRPVPAQNWRLAAQASLAAAQEGKFWEFMARATAAPGRLAMPDLEGYAREVGIDVNAFRSKLHSREAADALDGARAAAQDVGVTGPLPVFWVNGTIVRADEVAAKLRQTVDREIERARDLLDAPRSRCEVLARFVSTRQVAPVGPQPAAEAAPVRPARPREAPDALYKIPVGDSPTKGARQPLVTLLAFKDFECAPCTRAAETLKGLVAAFPNDLQVVFKHNPLGFHHNAPLAAEASLAAHAQGKFWEYHDKLFANQQAMQRADLERYAQELGLNMTKFRRALDQRTYQARVQQDLEICRRFGITGTPTLVMNGKKTPNLPPEAFKQRVEQEIARVKALVDSGTPRAGIYDKLIAGGSESVVFLAIPEGEQAGPPQPPPPPPGPPPLPADARDVKVESWNPFIGKADARVTIVNFCDYGCGYCRRVQPTLKELVQAYGGRVRVVFRNHVLFTEAASRAMLAAARQGKFEQMHDSLFANAAQAREQAGIEQLAEQAGLDMARFRADMDSAETRQRLEADKAEAARLGVTGTPTSFVNGRMLVGARPTSDWGSWIDQILGITTPTIPPSAAGPAPMPGGGCGAHPPPQ